MLQPKKPGRKATEEGNTNGNADDVLKKDWRNALDRPDPATRSMVAALVEREASSLSNLFYDEIMADERGGRMLDHEVVNRRLHASMSEWIRRLFSLDATETDHLALQRTTGEVHARIGVPMDLVARGGRVIKRELSRLLLMTDLERRALVSAIDYCNESIDLAIETMNISYERVTSRNIRSDATYRLFFLGQDMKAERERQKMQLMEWLNGTLMESIWPDGQAQADALPATLGGSPFGTWLEHKATIAFADPPEMAKVREQIDRVDRELLPRLGGLRGDPRAMQAIISEIGRAIDTIRSLLEAMFDEFWQKNELNDPATHLLSRRYFPIAARREVELARRQQTTFALLLVELDDLAQVRQMLGVAGTDTVMSQVAQVVTDRIRTADFAFRLGDERVGVLMVEIDEQHAVRLAEQLRVSIAGLAVKTVFGASFSVTASAGVAMFDGHPDYQRVLDKAEQALAAAKAGQRDSVRLST